MASDIVERLRAAIAKFTREGERALPWEVWNSCSYRRVKTAATAERLGGADILSAYNQRADNHPDLSMPEAELFALVEAVNMLPDLAIHIESQDAALRKARDAIQEQLNAEFSDPGPMAGKDPFTGEPLNRKGLARVNAEIALSTLNELLDSDNGK